MSRGASLTRTIRPSTRGQTEGRLPFQPAAPSVTVVGIDDTDSTAGMCTTFAAHRIAERLRQRPSEGDERSSAVRRLLLVRLNPAVEFKTRGNAALAVHTDADPETALRVAVDAVGDGARHEDRNTNPGVVVAPGDPLDVPATVGRFARRVVRDLVPPEAARERVADAGYAHETWGSGRGLVGALAAVGAWRGRGPAADWTYERIAYREAARRGTPREVDRDAVFAAADRGYPTVWDTVDRETGETVCVPHTPGPVLFGIRGDDPEAVREVAAAVDSEPVAAAETFVTNQGTDDHLRSGAVAAVEAGRSYRLDGVVVDAPETREGGHVFLTVAGPDRAPAASGVDADEAGESETSPAVARWALAVTADDLPADARLPCVAFEPTGRFRSRVRDLREGDRVTVCGEVSDGTLKLEKFALRSRRTVEPVVPTCPACGRSMESAGADQGYRCRDCDTSASGRTTRRVERPAPGWYEVPPTARRHVAKPLVRGGFDAPTRPER